MVSVDPIRVGVLGCASVAARRMLPAWRSVPELRLVAVASRSPEKAEEFATRFNCEAEVGYDRLLERPDVEAVYIPLPPGLHREWITRSLDAGKHVLAEKPLAITREDAVREATLATRRHVLLMENFAFLYHTQYDVVRDLLAQGAIGELRMVSGAVGFPPLDPTNFRYRARLGGGALLDAGVYPLRASQLFLGPNLEVAGAVLGADLTVGVDVAGAVLLSSSAGVHAEISFGFDRSYRSTCSLWGSTGELAVEQAFTPQASQRPVIRVRCQDRQETLTAAAYDQFAGVGRAFARTILEGGSFGNHYTDLIAQAALVDEVRRATQRPRS
jgi:NDP-hexose-3-ketoreductase